MRDLVYTIKKYRTLLVLVLMGAVASVLSDAFLSFANLFNVARQVSMTAIVAAGMTLVIITAGIDLSVGSMVALAGAVAAGFLQTTNSIAVALLGALLVGLAMGLFNGLLITRGRLPDFIVTLATMAIARGLTLQYTHGHPIAVTSTAFKAFGAGFIGPVPVPIVIMAGVYLVIHALLRQTRLGRYIYAVGGNADASRLSGINVNDVKLMVYALTGVLTAVTAVILTARLGSAEPTAGVGMELDAIAAVILGGTSLAGGQGGVAGTLVGALILGVMDNTLNLLNVSPFWQEVAKGSIILVAVLADNKLNALQFFGAKGKGGRGAQTATENSGSVAQDEVHKRQIGGNH